MIKHSKLGSCKPITVTVQWQIDLKKNPKPNIGSSYWLCNLRGIQGPLFTSLRSLTRYKAQTTQKIAMQCLNKFKMSTCFNDSNWFWRNSDVGPLSLVSLSKYISIICGSSKIESVCDLGVRFTTDCSWSPRLTRTSHGLGLQLGLDTLACLLRWWPRRKTSLGISEVFSISLG